MATLQLSPSYIPLNTATTVKIFGLNGTAWTGGTTASLSGGTGADIASQSTDATNQIITASIDSGTATGRLTITVGSASITLHVGSAAKHRWFGGLMGRRH